MIVKRTLAAILLALAVLAAPAALAQESPRDPEADNDTLGPEDRLVDEESTLEDAPGIAYYVVIAVFSVGVLIGLAILNNRYRRNRGSRPPP